MEIRNMTEKELLVSLIKDDLINIRLVIGLEKIGLDALKYHLYLSETVFKLMGFGSSEIEEDVYDHYISRTKQVSQIEIFESPEQLDTLALDIYCFLLGAKKSYK